MSDTEQQTSGIPPPKRVMSVVSTGSRLKAKLKKMELEHKRKLASLDSSYMKQIRQCEADILVHQTSIGDYAARKMEILGIPVENRSPAVNEVLQNTLDSEREAIFKIKIIKQKIDQLKAELEADKNAATTDLSWNTRS
ncbi:unnamed protein product [Orchesella dallaii]|uniref:Prefoldin subunit 1 n=1 Tax=Orchesella dallaii TaxID=48710 RepID=A0ABP1RDJ8_9HEXA